MRKVFGAYREEEETDREFISRLESQKDIPEETFSKINSFIDSYRAVRFGLKEDSRVKDSFEDLAEKLGTAVNAQ